MAGQVNQFNAGGGAVDQNILFEREPGSNGNRCAENLISGVLIGRPEISRHSGERVSHCFRRAVLSEVQIGGMRR